MKGKRKELAVLSILALGLAKKFLIYYALNSLSAYVSLPEIS
jgi:hypothetical protein